MRFLFLLLLPSLLHAQVYVKGKAYVTGTANIGTMGAAGGGGGGGSVGFDHSYGTVWSAGAMTTNVTVTVANTLMVVGISSYNARGASSITFNSNPLTKYAVTNFYDGLGNGGQTNSSVWFIVTSDTGTHALTFNYDSINSIVSASIALFTNINTVTPLGAVTLFAEYNADGTPTSINNSVTSATGDMIFDSVGLFDGARVLTPGGGQTKVSATSQFGSGSTETASYKAGAAGSTAMSWSSDGNTTWSQIIVQINHP